ncbi:hypothetical protein OF829_14445 [Sphingomonas sp. LB-2]|uniref:hypothetical protein n=1 Tax=Sphingomonas caeni TaxID=2984949 RepID=UPI00222EA7F1|nr:hypothetical protein [Sphingomonas caeni]MCW3848438.1 hypothetical protein [Sphingomonas caeni]
MTERAAEKEGMAAPAREGWLLPYRGIRFSTAFRWLLGGVLLYALLLLVAIKGRPDDIISPFIGPSFYLTPTFGLPFVLRTLHRPGRLRRLVYFLLIVPAVHMAAIYLAFYHLMSNFDPIDTGGTFFRALASGAWGGVTGAVLAFAGLFVVRLAPRRRAELAAMSFFTLLLGAIGAAGLGQAVLFAGPDLIAASHDSERLIIGFESVHLSWQAAFAFALAWLMRPPHAPRRAAAGGTPPAS